jgi:hypothetical protein
MICFRVSADDAPILSKQFEPQFEPNDLLQMHNRNFIINMVIKGEKSPAFSASTLTLPPPQTDNSSKIIENTRRHYSRSRAEVEQEIATAIQPPQNLQGKKPPVSAAQAKQWPINAQTQTVTPNKIVFKTSDGAPISPAAKPAPDTAKAPTTPPPAAPVQQQGSDDTPVEPVKKKRTRTRKRKPSAAQLASGEQPQTTPRPAREEQTKQETQPQTPRPEAEKAPAQTPKPAAARKPADETILRVR